MLKSAILLLSLLLPGVLCADTLDCTAYTLRPEHTTVAPPQSDSFLLEVTSDTAARSYLFATFHSADSAVLTTWSGLAPLLARMQPRVVVVERDLADSTGMARQLLPADSRLSALLSAVPGLFDATQALLKHYRLPADNAERLQPWFVGALLAQAPALPRHRSERILDQVLWDTARTLALPTKTLEDFSAIADYYEHQFSRDEQIRLLAEAVCNQALLTQAVQQQTAAYAANDVDTFYSLLHEFDGSDPALSTKLLDVFVRQRNAQFWHKLWPEIQQGGAFIAIGGLHLFGEDGLLPRLREQPGVTLRAIEPASLHFTLTVAERPEALKWVLNRTQDMGLTTMTKAQLASATMVHVPLSELRERLCPGRLCQIESSYSAVDQTLLFRDDIFARLLLQPTPATRNIRAYADSLLVRELMRHALSGSLQTAQASAKCINNAILHLASLAQHDYLREHQVHAKSHLFPLDSRCPALELR